MDKKKVKEHIQRALAWIDPMTTESANYETAIEMAAKNLEFAIQELSRSDWVSVEDDLPPYGEYVLAISKDGNMNVSYRRKIPRDKVCSDLIDNNGFILCFNLGGSEITYWKPIEKLEE